MARGTGQALGGVGERRGECELVGHRVVRGDPHGELIEAPCGLIP